MKSTAHKPSETGSDVAGIQMRTIVVVSLFIHLLILGIFGGTDGMSDDDAKRKYISVELIRNSRGFNKASRPAETKSIKQIETKSQSIEKKESVPEMNMSMTPTIASMEPSGAAKTIGTLAGPATAPIAGGDADYQTVHRISRLPIFRTQINPEYPASERNAGKESRVVVEVYLNRNGVVDEVKLIKSGGAPFDEAVIKALKASSFEPGYMDGKQVAVRMQIPYVFKLR